MTKERFNPNHIFVDTNVFVGGYSGNVRFQKDADCLHYLYSLTGKRLYISTLSVAQLISTFQKKRTFCKLNRKPMLPRGRRKAASGASAAECREPP